VIALVTGASSRIGAATVRRLAREPDARIVLVARREYPGVNHLRSDYQPSGGSRLPRRAESAWMTRGLTQDCGASEPPRGAICISPGRPRDVCRKTADSQPKCGTRPWAAGPVPPLPDPSTFVACRFQRRGRPADRSVRRHRRPPAEVP